MQQPRFAIATLSLGTNVHHNLPTKIWVASQLGYNGVEMFMPDFEQFVQQVKDGQHHDLFEDIPSFAPKNLSSSELELQPLRNFENFTSDEQIDAAVSVAERWFDLMPRLGTDLMLVCSNFIEGGSPVAKGLTTMDAYLDMQVRAFRRLGQCAAKYGVRVGYEPLAWGTVVDNWMPVWQVVSQVDMPNVGVILDSFNTLGNQYADPSTENSLRPRPFSVLLDNLTLMSRTIPGHKIFFYQIGDAHRPEQPIMDAPDAPARMTWSRASRLFPCEIVPDINSKDAWKYIGFLPVVEMTRALLATGYTGWWSLEGLQQESSGGR
ncbi:xylose isomerase-like protein [Amanita rubescens]|nr:xylose isomerase-like protein [Amanita rubescens]